MCPRPETCAMGSDALGSFEGDLNQKTLTPNAKPKANQPPPPFLPSRASFLGVVSYLAFPSPDDLGGGGWVPGKGPWAPSFLFACRPHALSAKEERHCLVSVTFFLARAVLQLHAAVLNLTSMSACRRLVHRSSVSFPLSRPNCLLIPWKNFRHSWLMSSPMVKGWRWHISVLSFSVLIEWPTAGTHCECVDVLKCCLAYEAVISMSQLRHTGSTSLRFLVSDGLSTLCDSTI